VIPTGVLCFWRGMRLVTSKERKHCGKEDSIYGFDYD